MLALAFDGALLTLQLNRPQFAPLSQIPPTITGRQSINNSLVFLAPKLPAYAPATARAG